MAKANPQGEQPSTVTPEVTPQEQPQVTPVNEIEGVFEADGRKFSRKLRNAEGDVEIVYLD